ncbi:MAG: HYR domain-containing protein [Saprospiraceae bacterium]|nr:HYR domain-containing protein [Saprospiraceae bacterium]
MIRAHLTTQYYYLKITLVFLLFGVSVKLSSQTTYYWVGGTGNWSDLSHWATTSGGSMKQTIVPSQLDDVVFDANSFTATGQTVTVNQAPFCKNFIWSGVTFSPTFNCTGYDFTIFGAFRTSGGNFSFTQDAKNLVVNDSLSITSNIVLNKSGGLFTVGKGVFMSNLTSAASVQAISSTLTITTGDFRLRNVAAGTVRFANLTISNGNFTVADSGPALFNCGVINVTLGSFKIKNWTGNSFQANTITIAQDSFSIDNWDSGAFSSSTITCNAARFQIKDWSGTTFTSGNISTNRSVKFDNWAGTTFQAGSITLAQDSFYIDNWDTGSFNSSSINCNAAKFHINNWSGGNFNCSGSLTTSTGGIKIKTWTSGNLLVTSSVAMSQDTFLIQNWSGGSATFNSSISCGNGRFQLSDWTAGSFSASAIAANVDSVVIRNWSVASCNISSLSATAKGMLIENWTSGAINAGLISNNDLIFRNAASTNTFALNFNSDLRKIIFDNAPINFNANTRSLTVRNDFNLNSSGVKYTQSGSLILYGSVDLTGATSFTYSGTVSFSSISTLSRINANNFVFANANFVGTGSWTLDGVFRVSGTTTHSTGSLISNGFRVYLGNVYDATSVSTKTLNLTGTDTLYVGYSFRMNSAGTTTLIKDAAILKMESNIDVTHIIDIPGKTLNGVVVNTLAVSTSAQDLQFLGTNAVFGGLTIRHTNNFRTYFNASGASYGNVDVAYLGSNANLKTVYFNTNSTLGNFTFSTAAGAAEVVTLFNNTFGNVVLPSSTTWTSTATRIQTVASLNLSGTCIVPAIIKSNTIATTTFTDNSGTNIFDYVQFQNVVFTGGATWQANNSLASNTTGLTLSAYAAQTFYWIGNGGNWFDPTHWSLTSGGVAASCVPNYQDNVIFDANSFTLANQRVTINQNLIQNSILVQNVANNPEIYSAAKVVTITTNLSFTGTASRFTHASSTLQVSGSVLISSSNVTWSATGTISVGGDFSIKGVSAGSYGFASSSLSVGDSLIIHNATLSSFTVGGGLTLTSGSLNLQNSNITTFTVASSIVCNNGSFLVQQGAITNFTVGAATFSKGFRIITSPSGNYTFNSGGLTLGDSLVIQNSVLSSFYLRFFNGSTYSYYPITLSAGSLYISGSSITNWHASFINVNNGQLKVVNNSSGTMNALFSVSSHFLIQDSPFNWSMSNFSAGNCSVGGNFTISNSQNSFTPFQNSLAIAGNFLIDTKPVVWNSQYPITVNGDYSVLNSSSSITSSTTNGTLSVRGNFTLNAGLTYSVYFNYFTATTAGKTIQPAGKIFTNVNFLGNGGAWTMLGDFTATGDVTHQFGTFISNGFKVDYGLGMSANYTNVINLNFTGTDTIRARYYYTLSTSANTTFTIGNATVKLDTKNGPTSIVFTGSGKTFKDVYLVQSGTTNSTNISLSGNNTVYGNIYISLDRFGTVTFSGSTPNYKDVFVNYKSTTATTSSINISGANTWKDLRVSSPKVVLTTTISAANTFDTLGMPNATSFTFQSGITQNWKAFMTNGNCDNIPVYKSSSAGSQATLNDLDGGTTELNFINIKDIKVTGGTWNASNVINGGNNTGINITTASSITYYWIGNGGNWTDVNHWSTTSGGTPSSCIPSQNDDVVFDIFSFSSNSQTVNVTTPITVRNMTWTSGVNRNPVFNAATLSVIGDLRIEGQVNINSSTTLTAGGDFILNQNVTWPNLSQLNFVSDSLNNVINFSNKSFNCNVLFNSVTSNITPQWTLASAFTINNTPSNTTTFTAGNLISGGFNVNFGRFFEASLGTRARNLNFTGTAELRAGYDWRVATDVNTVLNMGTSKLILDFNTTFVTINFNGGNKTYYDVEIYKYYNNGSTGYHANINNNNTFNSLLVNWRTNAAEDLNVQGTQIIGTFTGNFEGSPFTTSNLNFTNNNNQIGTFNLTTRGARIINVNMNGTGQNITNYNVTHSSTSTVNSNFQTGTHTIGSVNINGTTSGTINTVFSNGAHTVGNINVSSVSGSVSTTLQATNANYGNYTATVNGSASSSLSLINAMTVTDITMQSVNGTSRIVSQTGNKTLGKVKITTTGTGIPDPEFLSNTTIDRLELSQGFDMLIGSNSNITITNDFVATSNCSRQSRILGQNQTTSKITKTSGSVTLNYGILSTHTVTGGANFTATNTSNTSTTGWTSSVEPPLTYYWIGGTDNWSEVSHWALTSGGVSNGCKIPEPEDNVVFDQNSFTASNQFVTLNVNATVNNMIWSGALYNPGFGFTSNSINGRAFTVNGDLVINDAMRWQWTRPFLGSGYTNVLNINKSITLNPSVSWTHQNYVSFNTLAGSYQIDMAGKIFVDNVYFAGVSGSSLTLMDHFLVDPAFTTNMTTGKLISNGFNVDFGKNFFGNNSSAKELNFTSSAQVLVRESWEISTNVSNVLTMGTAQLLIQSGNAANFVFSGGNKTYSDVTIQHDNTSNLTITINGNNIFDDFLVAYVNRKDVTISGSNIFGTFTLRQNYDPTNNIPLFNVTASNSFNTFVILSLGIQGPTATFTTSNTFGNFISVGRNTRIKFAANLTQTFNGPMQVLGTGGQPIFMQSTTDGTRATISRANDNMCFDYIWIKDINAIGGATFLGGLNGVDLGNNMGITFNDNCVGYYWVGGSGNWSDPNHWATSSGGTNKQLTPPTVVDHVYFDANSFTAAGQIVTLDINGVCADMDWLASLFNPTFEGSATNLEIYGDLTLSPNMNIIWPGEWKLKGTTALNNVKLNNKQLIQLTFDASQSTGGYNISQPISVSGNLTISDGIVNTGGQPITTTNLIINSVNTKTINLGASEVVINEGAWDVQDNTAITFNAGTSTVRLLSNNGDVDFYGGGLTYNNVVYTTTTSMSGEITGNNIFNGFTAGGSTHLTLESGSFQTATNFNLGGACEDYLILDATTSGNAATLSKSSGILNLRFLDLTDIHATGGAIFNASQSINNSNNNGWNFVNLSSLNVTLSPTNATCPVPNNGSITAVVTGGVSPYSYRWNNLATAATITNLSPGTYTVTVTDDAGCTMSQEVSITQPASYGFTASATGSTVCFGTMTGTVMAAAPTGAAPLSYLWNNGSTLGTPTNLAAGTYTVTVTDANSCVATATAVVNSYAQLTASYSNTVSNCTNVAMTFTGLPNTAGFQYAWNFGDSNTANTRVASNTFATAGNYNVVLTVTDLNGCTDTEAKQITVVNPPSFTANTVSTTTCVSCNGFVNLNISQGTPPYTIVGSTPVSSLCAGSYTYQIRDANQCLSPSQSYTVSLNDLTKPTISGLTAKSSVVNTGCTATGISLGTPTVSDDCTLTANITVANNAPMGGIYPIGLTTVVWTATDQAGNSQVFNQLVTVTASDLNITGNGLNIEDEDIMPELNDNTDFGEVSIGSSVTNSFNLQNLGTASLSLTGSPRVMLKNNSHFSVSTQPASASIAVSGAALPFSIKYQPTLAGVHMDTVVVLSNDCDEAIYRFVVSGQVDCSIAINNVVTQDESCPGSDDGSLEVMATCLSCNSGADIRYSLDNSDFSNTTGLFENLPPATYTAYVRDVNNITCTSSSGPHTVDAGTDNEDPQITCPANSYVDTDVNMCSAVVNYRPCGRPHSLHCPLGVPLCIWRPRVSSNEIPIVLPIVLLTRMPACSAV